MRTVLTRFINDDRRIDRLLTVTMLITCVSMTALVAYTSSSSEDDGLSMYAEADGGSSLALRGAVFAQGDANGVNTVSFAVAIPHDGEPVNLTGPPDNLVVVSYADRHQQLDNLNWKCAQFGPGDGDSMLEAGETFRLEVDIPPLTGGTAFALELRTPDGRTLEIERTIPDEPGRVTNLR